MSAGPTLAERFGSLNVWKRGDARAPHKPLLVLLALGRLSRGQMDLPFADCDKDLTALLREFGPPSKSLHPEFPFWWLQTDGLWEIDKDRPLQPRSGGRNPSKSELKDAHARGHFPDDVRRELVANPPLMAAVAQRVLDAHFPETLHGDILSAVGLALEALRADATAEEFVKSERRRRDPAFRQEVLMAYQYRCAVCGLDVRLGQLSVGLEAAHIKWHQAHGPDIVANGISMCTIHHKLFDLGAFTLDPQGTAESAPGILVSEQVHGTTLFEHVLLRHHGQRLGSPVRREHLPRGEFVEWHRRQVFKPEARQRA